MTQQVLNGILLDESTELSLSDLCRVCASPAEWVIALVEEGVLEPVGYQQTQWRFPVDSLQRARTAMRLQRDLGINLAGVALAVELLEEISRLENRLRRLDLDEPS